MKGCKIIKNTQDIKLKLKQKAEIQRIRINLNYILWSCKIKKFLLQFSTEKNPLRVLDPQTQQISTPIKLKVGIRNMKLTKKQDKLVILDYNGFFWVIELTHFKIENKLKSKIWGSLSFVFIDKLCESVFVNSSFYGLSKINMVSEDSKKLHYRGFYSSNLNDFSIDSDHKIIYGTLEHQYECFPASYNVTKGFKYRVYSQKLDKFDNPSFTLSKKDTLLISGGIFGRLIFIDLRSDKSMNTMQIENQKCIVCLESKDRVIFGGTEDGHLFIIRNSFPFNVIFYQKINSRICSIGLQHKYFVIGGDINESVKLFEILDYSEASITTEKKIQ